MRRPTSADSRSAGSRTARCARDRQIAWCRRDGTIERARVTELYVTDALDRVPAEEAGPGEICAIAGLPEVTIGETLADADDPRPMPVVEVDEPSLSMTSASTRRRSPGSDGSKLTAPMLKQRLDQELIGNVSLRVVSRPSGPTPGRCRAAASCSSPSSSS